MLQVVPHSEKYYVYGPNMERLYVYRFSGYEQSEILVSKKLVSKAELKKTMEKQRCLFLGSFFSFPFQLLSISRLPVPHVDKQKVPTETEKTKRWLDSNHSKPLHSDK